MRLWLSFVQHTRPIIRSLALLFRRRSWLMSQRRKTMPLLLAKNRDTLWYVCCVFSVKRKTSCVVSRLPWRSTGGRRRGEQGWWVILVSMDSDLNFLSSLFLGRESIFIIHAFPSNKGPAAYGSRNVQGSRKLSEVLNVSLLIFNTSMICHH